MNSNTFEPESNYSLDENAIVSLLTESSRLQADLQDAIRNLLMLAVTEKALKDITGAMTRVEINLKQKNPAWVALRKMAIIGDLSLIETKAKLITEMWPELAALHAKYPKLTIFEEFEEIFESYSKMKKLIAIVGGDIDKLMM